jgi:DsbC/DsbD-like thiol-disulfide interchange protein
MLAAALCTAWLPTRTAAAVAEWVATEQTRARLISPWEVAPAATTQLELGLEIELAAGWHIYWINPGDAGYPPELTFPDAAVTMAFPAPTRYELPGDLVAFGYSDHVVYPLHLELATTPTEQIRLAGTLDFVVCEDECIPYRQELALSLPVGEARLDAPHRNLLDHWLGRVPLAPAAYPPGVTASWTRLDAAPGSADLSLRLQPGTTQVTALDLFFEPLDGVSLTRPRLLLARDRVELSLSARSLDTRLPLPDPLELSWVLTGLALDQVPVALAGNTALSADSPIATSEPQGQACPLAARRLPIAIALALLFVIIGIFAIRRANARPSKPIHPEDSP